LKLQSDVPTTAPAQPSKRCVYRRLGYRITVLAGDRGVVHWAVYRPLLRGASIRGFATTREVAVASANEWVLHDARTIGAG
jgi:hypothetical protein